MIGFVLLIILILASALPRPEDVVNKAKPADSDISVPVPKFITPVIKTCSATQIEILREGWEEAGMIATEHKIWKSDMKQNPKLHQDIMDMYLGVESGQDSGTGPVRSNILRQYGIHYQDSTHSPTGAEATFWCDETKAPRIFDKKLCETESYLIAYTWDILKDSGIAHHVVFCPPMFSNRTQSLKDAHALARLNPKRQKIMDYWRYVRAGIVLHESYHWQRDVSRPRCVDKGYSPKDVVDLASHGTWEAMTNAESFVQAAFGIHVRRYFNMGKDFPKPDLTPDNEKDPELLEAHKLRALVFW